MRVRFHRFAVPVLAAIGLSVWAACGEGTATAPASWASAVNLPLADPQLVRFDAAAPAFDFAGEGSVVLGSGWGRAEQDDRPPRWFAWMLDGEASVYVPQPTRVRAERVALDFVAEVMPYAWTGRLEQRLTLWHGERSLGHAVLEDGWTHVRIALPDDALAARETELVLRAAIPRNPRW